MKNIYITSFFLFIHWFFTGVLNAQTTSDKTTEVAIKVLENQYMKGKASVSDMPAKKVEVKFSPQVVTVKIPDGEKSILLEIENTDCKAFCPKEKRIRQLRVGDEKLLLNLIEENKAQIMKQIKS